MNTLKKIKTALVLMLCSHVLSAGSNAPSAVLESMTGHWEGNARIVVNWCEQPSLHVAVDIHLDGSVTGTVGDARLVNARLERNRGWIGRKLNLATDYIIRGELDGPVVAAENFVREGVHIPLNFVGGDFSGAVHTTGSKFGGKDRMILTAMSLELKR